VDEAGETIDTADVSVEVGGTSITISGDGDRADEIVPQMVASIDWGDEPLQSISVSLTASDSVDSPADEWESPNTDTFDNAAPGSKKRAIVEALAEIEPAAAEAVVDETGISQATVGSTLSKLFTEGGLVDRKQVPPEGGGLRYVYRVNVHGRAVIDD
jgi:DNA-binding transcriptional ArsR family regulator